MLKKEVIKQLESLRAHCESMKESGEEWEKDVQALDIAIKELERTAQEVPVQEQLQSSITTELSNTKVIIEFDGITIKSPEIILQNQ